ncbi:MAG TPA: histidine phosphatase family protein [Candidatus Competibacteraceae bacterium]|nr:MAG: phosphohistidine phosphatase [Candidatus Competibacteraceae bacterium]HOB62968.1 histidine phosphatase family protein [Candidatus Competibacteraceae bacterium]HQA26841.1 histidine phosphatase family protein [Candidatus Competibacteraceae bacterium]HQD57181.1 histidine phosphatase family protein [Candidatus Competibacteraceae bacterium]
MKLLMVRHAIAEDAEVFISAGGTDAQRPLTDVGRKKMRKGANRLRTQLKQIDVLACSPLLRARETAEIVARAYGDLPIVERPELDFGYPPETVLAWLAQYPPDSTVVTVGHEPQLGLLAGLLLSGVANSLIVFRKGGVALIGFPGRATAGEGVLEWALTAGQLRSLKQD